jgi:uncharacterized membrane protein YczE
MTRWYRRSAPSRKAEGFLLSAVVGIRVAGFASHKARYRRRMLPSPSRHELFRRLPRLVLGLALFGVGVAMQVIAALGLSPWSVLHQGISDQTGIPFGTVVIITGVIVLLLWIPLRERWGIGTVLNVFVIGFVIDLFLWAAPEEISQLWLRWVLLLGGILVVAIGSGFYIGAGLGPGPRDGLMTGLARKGVNVGIARFVIEVTALGIGWALGGNVGIGTVLFAFGMGPLIAVFLPRLSLEPLPGREVHIPPAAGAGQL